MKKKTTVILIILVLIAVAGIFLGRRFLKRGTDIIGVTTLPKKNTVIMNSATGSEFVSGSGLITVGEGEHIELSYALTGGSFDITIDQGKDPVLEAAEELGTEVVLPVETEGEGMPEEHFLEQAGFEGKGSAQFEAAPGDYTVQFIMHGAVGTASVSTKKG